MPCIVPKDVRATIIGETLAIHYNIPGENLPLFQKALGALGFTSDGLDILAEMAKLLSKEHLGEVLGRAAGAAELFDAIMFPVTTWYDLKHAWESPYRYIGMKAAAWAITAWVFNEPAQPPPKEDLKKIHKTAVSQFVKVWNDVSSDVFGKLDALAKEKKIPKRTYQYLLSAAVDFEATKLAQQLFEGFNQKLSDYEKKAFGVWWTDYPVRH